MEAERLNEWMDRLGIARDASDDGAAFRPDWYDQPCSPAQWVEYPVRGVMVRRYLSLREQQRLRLASMTAWDDEYDQETRLYHQLQRDKNYTPLTAGNNNAAAQPRRNRSYRSNHHNRH